MNKYLEKIAAKQDDLRNNPAFQRMQSQRGVLPSEKPMPGTVERKPIKAITADQGRANLKEELARQQQERINQRPLNSANARRMAAIRDAQFEQRSSKKVPIPEVTNDASGRDLRSGRQIMANRTRLKPDYSNATQAVGPTHSLPTGNTVQAPSTSTSASFASNRPAGYAGNGLATGPTHSLPTGNTAQAPGAGTIPKVTQSAAAPAEDTVTRVAKMLSKYKKPAIALGALGLGGYALSGRNTDTELYNK